MKIKCERCGKEYDNWCATRAAYVHRSIMSDYTEFYFCEDCREEFKKWMSEPTYKCGVDGEHEFNAGDKFTIDGGQIYYIMNAIQGSATTTKDAEVARDCEIAGNVIVKIISEQKVDE